MTLKYEIVQHGVEHGQFFQGAGVYGTEFTEIVTGAGDTEHVAGQEALEQFYRTIDQTKVSTEECDALAAEIEKLDDEHSAHKGCEIDFNREFISKRKWTVSRQRPWDGEPAEEFIEISPGDEHFSPGACGRPFTSHDPMEIVETALGWARGMAPRRRSALPIYIGGDQMHGEAQDRDSLIAWAAKQVDAIGAEREAAWEKAHEFCEINHYVSIRWAVEG